MSRTAPDGSPIDVYLALPPREEPEMIHGAIPAHASILELGCGVGRVTHRLVALGHAVVAVDQSSDMLGHVQGAEAVLADIETLALGRRFDAVVLASHLVNTVDRAQRTAFLGTCARHALPGGAVLIQRLDPTAPWGEGLYESVLGPVKMALRIIRRDGNVIVATLDYEIEGRTIPQAFSAEILDDAALNAALRSLGLVVDRYLDPLRTWVRARLVP